MIEALAPVMDTWGKLSPTQKIIAAGVGGAGVVFIAIYRRGGGASSGYLTATGGSSYGGTGGGPVAGSPPSSPPGATPGPPPPASGPGDGNTGVPPHYLGPPAVGPWGNTVSIDTPPAAVMPAGTASSGWQSILSWWQDRLPALVAGGSPASMFGTVQRDAGPTASLSGPEYALTQIPGLTAQQLTAAAAGLSGGAAAGPGGAFGVGSLDTLYARSNNLTNALNVESPAATAARTGLPAGAITIGASTTAGGAAVAADLRSIQDAILKQTAQAWGDSTLTAAQTAGIVATWAPSDRAAYNQLHGTSY